MSSRKPLNYKLFILLFYAVSGIFWLSSCSVIPRNYPKNKPFVYEYNIKVEGNLKPVEKNKLISGLKNQLDDSIRVRSSNKFFYHGLNRQVLEKPPVFQSINAERSVIFMKDLLNAQGYFRDSVSYDTTMRFAGKDQYRTTVNFTVLPGKPVLIDSIKYTINQPELQQITDQSLNESFIKAGDPFAKATISNELDRLVDLYRNKGFMRFSREELIGIWDTLNPAILNPSLDPFEQIALLDSIRKSNANPKANLEISLKSAIDSNKLIKYYVGDIEVYPDYNMDTTGLTRKEKNIDGINIIHYRNIFKPKIFPPNIYFRRGDLYSQKNYLKTINRLNSLGAWRLVNIEQNPRYYQDTTDFIIKLSPANKYSFTTDLEASRNQTAFSGNLFGIALNFGLQNRNFARSANQTITNLRFNIETGRDTIADVKFIQTRQLILSHAIYFPRSLPNMKFLPPAIRENFKTIFAVNLGTTLRRSLYNLNSFNTSWGYEFQWNKKFVTIRLPNIEFSSFQSKPLLDTIFFYNPSLRYIFTDGFISSVIAGITVNGGRNKNVNAFRFNIEESGLLTGMIRNKFLDSNLYRFLKIDIEFVRKIRVRNSALVMRLFTGIGYEFSSTVNPNKKNSLPFFRQYFGGGPNSMRAWALRKLGPGSVIKGFGATGVPDRYADFQLEGNLEYRFPFFTISGVPVNGALFADMGNIWFLKKNAGSPEEVFKPGRLYKDLAIGTGIGFRIDFDFFVVRLDYSYKAKDPSPSPENAAGQNKWYYGTKLLNGQLQLGISYPFIQ
jgi:outer membrane protein assembly factor BamA